MDTTEIISIDGHQAAKLPDEFRFDESTVAIRKEGDAVILEPVRLKNWPAGFFDEIRVDDPQFTRPPQGETPPAPVMDIP